MGQDGRRGSGPRCIALVGPFASGKTTLLEAILARTEGIPRQGHVAQGNTVGDASPEARAHAMSVEVNVADCDFLGETFTFIDCPGSVEFTNEAQGVLPGVDIAIVVCEADDKKVPALQVIPRGFQEAWDTTVQMLSGLKQLFTSTDTLRDVSGPIGMAQATGEIVEAPVELAAAFCEVGLLACDALGVGLPAFELLVELRPEMPLVAVRLVGHHRIHIENQRAV